MAEPGSSSARERNSSGVGDEYTIRQYRERDSEELLSLYQDVLDPAMTRPWFQWKYRDNPYVDDIPVYVAEKDGEVVGGAGFWVLTLHTGRRSIHAVQPCDAAVHPDHRRRGLYTRILGRGLERFADEGVQVAFDFPNRKTRGAFEQYGWRIVEERSTYYRLQRPTDLLGSRMDGPLFEAASRGATLLARGYLGIRTRVGRSDRRDIGVECHEDVPAETLASVYRRRIPDRFHGLRDARFYCWRFENPQWDYTTYVGRRGGTPVVAILTGTRRDSETGRTRVVDAVPLVSDRRRNSAFAPVLEAVLADNEGTGVLTAPPVPIPPADLRRYGFHSDRSFPLSRLSTPKVHGVFSLAETDDADWVLDGKRLADADNWLITFGEYDAS